MQLNITKEERKSTNSAQLGKGSKKIIPIIKFTHKQYIGVSQRLTCLSFLTEKIIPSAFNTRAVTAV